MDLQKTVSTTSFISEPLVVFEDPTKQPSNLGISSLVKSVRAETRRQSKRKKFTSFKRERTKRYFQMKQNSEKKVDSIAAKTAAAKEVVKQYSEKSVSENKNKRHRSLQHCPIKDCDISTRKLRNHMHLMHLPKVFLTKLPSHDPSIHKLRYQALQELSFWILGDRDSVTDLLTVVQCEKIAESVMIPPDIKEAMIDLCKHVGWSYQVEFKMSPPNHPAVLLHWRALAILMNLLTPEQRTSFRNIFEFATVEGLNHDDRTPAENTNQKSNFVSENSCFSRLPNHTVRTVEIVATDSCPQSSYSDTNNQFQMSSNTAGQQMEVEKQSFVKQQISFIESRGHVTREALMEGNNGNFVRDYGHGSQPKQAHNSQFQNDFQNCSSPRKNISFKDLMSMPFQSPNTNKNKNCMFKRDTSYPRNSDIYTGMEPVTNRSIYPGLENKTYMESFSREPYLTYPEQKDRHSREKEMVPYFGEQSSQHSRYLDGHHDIPRQLSMRPELEWYDCQFHFNQLCQKLNHNERTTSPEQILACPHPVSPTIPAYIAGGVLVYSDPPLPKELPSFPGWKVAVGVHPQEVQDLRDVEFEKLSYLASNPGAVLGVIGLDRSVHPSLWLEQDLKFKRLLRLSRPSQPIILHARGPVGDPYGCDVSSRLLQFVKEVCPSQQPIQLHCFTGMQLTVMEWLKEFPNCYFSVAGIARYADPIHEEGIRAIPEDRLLLETDSPYLCPNPNSEVNTPNFIADVAAIVARIRGETLENLSETTSSNARWFFGL